MTCAERGQSQDFQIESGETRLFLDSVELFSVTVWLGLAGTTTGFGLDGPAHDGGWNAKKGLLVSTRARSRGPSRMSAGRKTAGDAFRSRSTSFSSVLLVAMVTSVSRFVYFPPDGLLTFWSFDVASPNKTRNTKHLMFIVSNEKC